ncbi:MAG TPA: TetR/AcrR family transcriptional regulator [Spirochaetota bacterium]|nr:TetR/AcrR family transcriptional regulator [Spirochaetota bacterium]HPJ35257.1 TetR/AcrR family transcriptional regulator [Spirochaetota bacterium]
MKRAFFNIPDTKRDGIIEACIREFGTYGYEKSSTDRIIKAAGISKGGLYEYISTKEELFLYIADYSYKALYSHIREHLKKYPEGIPADILERFRLVSSVAIDFYIKNPDYIKFISHTGRLNDPALEEKTKKIFMKHFLSIFGTISGDNLLYNRERLIDMLIWLLAKTRDDFLHSMEKKSNMRRLKKIYQENWDFYLSVLKTGIYK